MSLAAAPLAACGSDPTVCIRLPPAITLNPAAVDVVAGDSTSLTITVAESGPRTMIRVTSPHPATARADSLARSGVPILVRAGAAGATVLLVTATQDGVTSTASVPVTVRPRP